MSMLFLLRAGVWDEQRFLSRIPKWPITMPEAAFTSPSDASMTTFRGYLREPVSYYVSGNILGLVLDLSILNDTKGKRRLDDVFRSLWKNFYLRGRGFTPEDLERTVSAVAGRSYADFFRKHVRGTEPPPVLEALGYAGFSAERQDVVVGQPIAAGEFVQGGYLITRPPPSSVKGFEKGDLIVAADGKPGVPWPNGGQADWARSRPGQKLAVTVRRGDEEVQLSVVVPSLTEVNDSLRELPNVTPAQLQVRQAWLSK